MTKQGDSSDTERDLVTVGATGPEHQPADAAEEWQAAQAVQRSRSSRPPASAQDTIAEQITVEDTVAERDVDERHTDVIAVVDVSQDEDAKSRIDAQPDEDESPVRNEHAHGHAQIPDELSEQEWAEHVAAAPAGPTFADVQDEQLRPVPRRPGRGGFDPEAAEATRAYRYQQRRRITLILLIATVAFSVTAFLFVSWLWIGAAVSLVLLVGYLSYLRRQVRIEAAIRQKRMERLQRARQIRPEYARPQRRTSRAGMSAVAPGRTVVDLEDDDPGFDDLEEFRQPVTYRRAAGQ
jgi:hypothetical protein